MTANFVDVDRVGQMLQRDRAFVLVAVVGAGQDRARAIAVSGVAERQHNRTPGGVVTRMRYLQKTVLQAIAFEVDGG